jgi:hypothetical protein
LTALAEASVTSKEANGYHFRTGQLKRGNEMKQSRDQIWLDLAKMEDRVGKIADLAKAK